MKKYSRIVELLLSAVVMFFLLPVHLTRNDLLLFLQVLLLFSLSSSSFVPFAIAIVFSTFLFFEKIYLAPFVILTGSALRFAKVKLDRRIFTALRNFWVSGALAIVFKVVSSKLMLASVLVLLGILATLESVILIKFRASKRFLASVILLYLLLVICNVPLAGFSIGPSFLPIALYPLFFVAYLFLQKYESERQEYLSEIERMRSMRKKLATVIDLTNIISQRVSVEDCLYKLAEAISSVSGFRYVLINVLDKRSGKILRVAHHGINAGEFERLRKYPPPIENFYRLAQERFKLSNSYFIPQGTVDLPSEYVAVLMSSARFGSKDAQVWMPEDILLIPIYNPDREIAGYISVDAPIDGRRPSIEDVQVIELIADQVYKILERSQSYQSVVLRASRDPHTLVLTHSAFLGLLEQQTKSADEFVVVIMDIDDLGKINLKYGPEVGDMAIEKVADALRSKTRKTDYVARYSGGEFALLLRNVSKTRAIEITARILDEIRKIEMPEGIKITASAGLAVYPEHGKNHQELLEAAKKALTVAKKSGKDRLMVF